jgi:hypothetical protein
MADRELNRVQIDLLSIVPGQITVKRLHPTEVRDGNGNLDKAALGSS